MKKDIWRMLQLFADGAPGGTGDGGAAPAATGENSADAGQQRLLELGVPADRLRKRAKGKAVTLPEGAVRTAPKEAQQQTQQAAAAEEDTQATEEPKEAPPKRMSWEEIMADPEYNGKMQQTMQARLKTAKAAEENLGKLTPALATLAKYYGQDPENLDYEALGKAIGADDKLLEHRAMENGVETDVQRKLDHYEVLKAEADRRQQQTVQQRAVQQHFAKLEAEGEALKKVFPTFDLRKEMQNPVFARLTAPNSGISLEDAYHAVHRKEIQQAAMQVTAQKTAEQISKSIQAGTQRPVENGTSSQAPSVTTFDYSKASKAEREALKREIRRAGAEGRKIYPGR